MAVTARFIVGRISPPVEDDAWAHEVEMTPDYAEGRNADWKARTPSGVFRLTIGHEAPALKQFERGHPVHITMTFPGKDE